MSDAPLRPPGAVKRFYETVAAEPAEGGFAVRLDARRLATPEGRALLLPTMALAEAIAREWAGQGERLDPRAMPLTRLANTAIDRIGANPRAALDELGGFAACDLLCYRAESPESLVRRQEARWQPLLDWLAERHGARLAVARGIVAVAQTSEALTAVERAFARESAFRLAGAVGAVGLLGSAVLVLALLEGRLSPEDAWEASRLDEEFQIAQWGRDAENEARTARLKAEFDAAHEFLVLSVP
ncbi:MAG: ATPase [Alphaproteobacteria bacterium]|nr:ATPase [Alphaproteobacteria bacterium]